MACRKTIELKPHRACAGTTNISAAVTHRVNGAQLSRVSELRGRRMRVDIVHVLWCQPRARQRALHGQSRTMPPRRRLCDVVCVPRGPKAPDLSERCRATRARMRQRLKHKHARALGHDKPVTPAVKRAAGRRWRAVERCAEGLHAAKAVDGDRIETGLGRARQHQGRIAALELVKGLAECVQAGRARRGRRADGAPKAVVYAYRPCMCACDASLFRACADTLRCCA